MKNTIRLLKAGVLSKLRLALAAILLAFLCLGIFSGCQNFINGSLIKDELEKEINYANSPYVTLSISADVNQGTTIPAANVYKDKYKTTDTETISFTARSEYQFLYWQATPAEAVKFGNVKDATTWVEFVETKNKDTEIVITPVCAERPYPTVDPNSTGGNKPKNTPITISFDQIIQNPEEDLAKIDIQIAGESILSHFKAPVFTNEKRTILFDADDDNLLDFTSGTRVVNVIIPDTLYYTMPDGTEVHMNGEVTSSFTIDYTTRDSAVITLEVDDAAAGKLNRTGNHTFYMGEEFTVIYTVSDGYQFGGWNVSLSEGVSGTIKEEDGKVYLDDVAILEIVPNGEDFDEEYYASINKYQVIYRVIAGSRDVKISPVYYLKPVIQSILPLNTETVAKNSPIVINFSKKMNISEDELKKITITIDGLDVKSYFEEPVMADNASTGATQITYKSKRNKLLSVSGDTKNIIVTVPKSFCYEEDGEKVTLLADFVYTYVINNNTVDKINLEFGNVTGGNVEPSAPATIYLDGKYTVSCTPDEKYQITGWKIYEKNPNNLSDESKTIPEEILGREEAEDYSSVTVTALDGYSGTIVVKPVCTPKKKVTFTVTSKYGTTIPAGTIEKTYYSGDNFTLSFREDSDYQFTGWKISEKNNKEIADILGFSVKAGKEIDNSVVIGTLTEDLDITVEAECTKRPKVVSSTPSYDSNGVYRDRRVIIIFDNEMDESSIYYNESEQEKLVTEGKTLLKIKNVNNVNYGKCYGYWDGTNEDTYVYKNIVITNRKNKNVNLLSCYEPPYFDKDDKSVLRIDAKQGEHAPPAVTDILVLIEKSMNTFESEKNVYVELANEYSWLYYTNSRVDTDAPQFTTTGDDAFVCQFADNGQEDYDNSRSIALKSLDTLTTDQTHINNNLINKKLFVKGTFSDGGSGPASLKWNLYKVNSSYYPMSKDKLCDSGQIDDLDIVGANASIKTKKKNSSGYNDGAMVEIKKNLEEGTYRIDFIAYDKNEWSSDPESFYFVHDTTPPKLVDKNSIKNSRPSAENETITWTDPDNTDVAKIYIEQYLNGEKKAGYEVAKGVQSRSFTGMSKGKYQYKIYSEDICGNRTKIEDTTEWQDDVKPAAPDNVSTGAVGKKRIRINYTVPDCEDYDYLNISGSASAKIENGEKGTKYFFEHSNIPGKIYDNTYYLQSVDFAGNLSEPVSIKPKASDVKPGMICYKSKTDNNVENFLFSFEYISDMDPLGVVCDSSDTTKIKIWDLSEVTGWNWGKDAKPCSNEMGSYGSKYYWDGRNHADGLTWYNLILKDYWYLSNDKINGHYTIWNWLRTQKNVNAPVTWYIPGIYEYESIINNYSKMKESFDLLSNNGKSVKLFTEKQPYWTASPRYDAAYANVVMLNQSNDGCAHELCKNGSNTLYITGDNKQSGLYYKDELMGNPISHAMAQINIQ